MNQAIKYILGGLTTALIAGAAIAAPASAAGGLAAIDGDTYTDGGPNSVRIVGIDTPEAGHPCWAKAKARLDAYLSYDTDGVLDVTHNVGTDRYGRRLLSTTVVMDSGMSFDLGLAMIKSGYAVARYDGLDGYGSHPQQAEYRAASRARAKDSCHEEEDEGHLFTFAALAYFEEVERNNVAAFFVAVARQEAEAERIRIEERERASRRNTSNSSSSNSSNSGRAPCRAYDPGGKTFKYISC